MLRHTLLVLGLATFACAALPPGQPLPDVPISQPGGKKLDLKQYRGKALVVALISTTCKDCAQTVDFLKLMQAENAAQGLQVVAAAGDTNAVAKIVPFARQHKLNFPIGFLDREGFIKMASLKPHDRPFVPVLLFVDPKGMVRVQLMGDDPLLKKLESAIRGTIRELLKEPGIKSSKQ